jgi:hypothetical protein
MDGTRLEGPRDLAPLSFGLAILRIDSGQWNKQLLRGSHLPQLQLFAI